MLSMRCKALQSGHVEGKPLQVELSEAMESVLLTSTEELAAGEVTLALKFKSLLNDKMHGFYRSTYTCSETGETRYIASTQFEVCLVRPGQYENAFA